MGIRQLGEIGSFSPSIKFRQENFQFLLDSVLRRSLYPCWIALGFAVFKRLLKQVMSDPCPTHQQRSILTF